jgi:hypothetical protein
MRGTLHLLAAEDLEWLLPVVVPPVLDSAGAGLARLGVASLAPRAVRIIERALASAGPLTRAELTERLARGGIEARGQAPFHLIRLACLKGVACAGPDRGKQPTFVLLRDWVSPGEALDREEGAAELARRYLAAYGPADPADLAAWAGLPLTVARDAFRRIQGELAPMGRGGGRPLMSLRAARPRPARADLVRLLPRFDTYLLGYRSREFAVPRRFAKEVHPGGGIIHPTMVRAGEVVGTWRLDRGRRAVRVASHPFHLLTRQMWRALEREAADVGRFLGLEAAIIRA